ncbi:MAG: recombinase RecT [Planctomycetales bacterium]|nr:recombinase RecT [Planctomycetales bacterium]
MFPSGGMVCPPFFLFLEVNTMSLQALKNINRNVPSDAEQPKGFPAMLEQFKGEIARALPKHINPDRMARIALTAFRMTPKLGECDPRSVFAAVIQSSQMGLEVGLMGEAHLVPFGNQCQLIPGYTGLMKLARQSGLVQDIYAHEVRVNDSFTLKLGMERSLDHEPLTTLGGFPASDDERGDVAGFYAVAVFKDGSRTFVAMGRKEIEKIRDNSRGYQSAKRYKKESVWDSDFTAMGLKTAIRRLCKFLPKSPELASALALDAAAEQGTAQNLNLTDVIEGNYAPIIDDETGEITDAKIDSGKQAKPSVDQVEVVGGSGKKVKTDGATPIGTEPSAVSPSTTLQAIYDQMASAKSVEALDEIYVRAEGGLEGTELEALMREYRKCKANVESLI